MFSRFSPLCPAIFAARVCCQLSRLFFCSCLRSVHLRKTSSCSHLCCESKFVCTHDTQPQSTLANVSSPQSRAQRGGGRARHTTRTCHPCMLCSLRKLARERRVTLLGEEDAFRLLESRDGLKTRKISNEFEGGRKRRRRRRRTFHEHVNQHAKHVLECLERLRGFPGHPLL